jgi:hypothetical protein
MGQLDFSLQLATMSACPRPISTVLAFESTEEHKTHYCIVRRDLSPGLQAANLIHAAGESSPGNLPSGTYAVALTVANEPELRAMHERLLEAAIPCRAIIETEGRYADQIMVIGVEPMAREVPRRLLSSLPLLK